MESQSPFVCQSEPFRWENIPVLVYKEDGTHFHKITRQILFEGREELPCQLRYFEIQPGGHSTFEKHQHVHSVLTLRGKGHVLVGDTIREIHAMDGVQIPPMTWHQFQADLEDYFGFLCIVHCERDRPIRPTPEDVAQLQQNPAIAHFMKL